MKLLFLLVTVAFALPTEAQIDLKEVTPEMKVTQEKATSLIVGDIEPPSDWVLGDHKDLFQNEDTVDNFLKYYNEGLLAKDKQFNIRDPHIKEETIAVFELLFYTKDFDSLYKVASWLYGVMNYEQYTYALSVALIHRQDIVVKLPPWTEVFPNYFVPNEEIKGWKSEPLGDGGVLEEDEVILWSNTTYGPGFFAEDPALAMMYYNWQLEFPTWLEPSKYGLPDWEKRTELMLAYHYQILSAFIIYAQATMPGDFKRNMSDISIWNWLNLQFAFGEGLMNSVNQPIIQVTVPANYVDPQVAAADDKFISMERPTNDIALRFQEASHKQKAATVFNMTGSIDPNFFGSYFDTLVNFLAIYGSKKDKDGGNLAGYPMTALKDPQYYTVLDKITIPILLPDTTIKTFKNPMDDMRFVSVEVSDVKTKYRTYDMDISRWINKQAPKGRFKARQMVLDHSPFVVTMKIENNGTETQDVIVRLLIGPGSDYTRNFEPWTIAMRTHMFLGVTMEIDRFLIRVPPGVHTEVRDLKNSPIFSSEDEDSIQCGLPNRLILPRGSTEGVKLVLISVMNSYKKPDEGLFLGHDEEYYKKSLLCGSRYLDDGLPLGHPNWNNGHGISHLRRKQHVLTEFKVYKEEDKGTIDDKGDD